MAEELMTAKDAADCQMYAEDGMNPPWSRERARRMYATYAECTRLRAALTEREGECERLREHNADLTENAGALYDELVVARQRVAEEEADTARVTCKHTGKIIRGYENGYDMAWCDECGEITWCSDGSIPSYAHGFMQRTDWCKTRVVAYGCASEARSNLSKIQDGKLCSTWCGHDYCPVSLDAARGPRTGGGE